MSKEEDSEIKRILREEYREAKQILVAQFKEKTEKEAESLIKGESKAVLNKREEYIKLKVLEFEKGLKKTQNDKDRESRNLSRTNNLFPNLDYYASYKPQPPTYDEAQLTIDTSAAEFHSATDDQGTDKSESVNELDQNKTEENKEDSDEEPTVTPKEKKADRKEISVQEGTQVDVTISNNEDPIARIQEPVLIENEINNEENEIVEEIVINMAPPENKNYAKSIIELGYNQEICIKMLSDVDENKINDIFTIIRNELNNLITTLNGSTESDKATRIAAAQSDIKNADKLQNILTGYKLARLSNVNTENNQRKVEVNNLFRNIKPFEGLNGDFNLWANEIERVSKAKKYSEIEQYYLAVDTIVEQLKPLATQFEADCEKRHKTLNWIEFRDFLKKIYASEDKNKTYRAKLMKMRLSHYNKISDFNDAFIKLITCIGLDDMSDKEQLMCYTAAIDNSEISNAISKSKIENVWDCIAFTNRDFAQNDRQERSVNYASKIINRTVIRPKEFNRDRIKFDKQGYHKGSNKPNNDRKPWVRPTSNKHTFENNKKKTDTPVCYTCNKPGHFARNCNMKRNLNVAISNDDEKEIECNTIIMVSNRISTIKNYTIPTTEVDINGKKILAFIDTGANCSIMSANVAKHNKYFIEKSNIVLKLGDDSKIKPLGQTRPLPVRIRNVVHDVVFTVIDQDSHPILLGNDWLSPADAYVHPLQSRIVFKDELQLQCNSFEIDPDSNGFPYKNDEIDEVGICPSEEIISLSFFVLSSSKSFSKAIFLLGLSSLSSMIDFSFDDFVVEFSFSHEASTLEDPVSLFADFRLLVDFVLAEFELMHTEFFDD